MRKHVQKYLVVPKQSGGEKWRRQTDRQTDRQTEPHLHKVSSDT